MAKQQKKLTRKEVKKQLNEIIELFHKVPQKQISKKAIKATKKCSEIVNQEDTLQELIDYLRVGIKYMLLDIEALKRENKNLKKLLGDKK